MSTNRTENYQLHVWGAEDEERLAEINENFATIDEGLGSKCEVVTGGYVGSKNNTDDHQNVELGFSPRMVLVWAMNGLPNISGFNYMGAAMGLKGAPGAASQYSSNIRVLENGFRVRSDSNCSLNDSGTQYYFMAVR